jgi:hypothetical protein
MFVTDKLKLYFSAKLVNYGNKKFYNIGPISTQNVNISLISFASTLICLPCNTNSNNSLN